MLAIVPQSQCSSHEWRSGGRYRMCFNITTKPPVGAMLTRPIVVCHYSREVRLDLIRDSTVTGRSIARKFLVSRSERSQNARFREFRQARLYGDPSQLLGCPWVAFCTSGWGPTFGVRNSCVLRAWWSARGGKCRVNANVPRAQRKEFMFIDAQRRQLSAIRTHP